MKAMRLAISDVVLNEQNLFRDERGDAFVHEFCVCWDETVRGIRCTSGVTPILMTKDQTMSSLAYAEVF